MVSSMIVETAKTKCAKNARGYLDMQKERDARIPICGKIPQFHDCSNANLNEHILAVEPCRSSAQGSILVTVRKTLLNTMSSPCSGENPHSLSWP